MSKLFSVYEPAKESAYEDEANWISKYLLLYMNPIFEKGYKHSIKHDDLGCVPNQDKCERVFADFLKEWNLEKKKAKNKRSLWFVLWRTTSYLRVIYGLALYGIFVAFSFGPVVILNKLVLHLQGSRILSQRDQAILVALIFIFPTLGSIFSAQSNVVMSHIGLQFRNALITMIYRKSLRLSPSARQEYSTGNITNMFSNDTAQLQLFLVYFNSVVTAPFQIIASLVLIYQQVGVSTFVGLALLVLILPISAVIFGYLGALRHNKIMQTDGRVKLMNEILAGIRIIKNYAWEEAFAAKIDSIREKELIVLKQVAYVVAIGFSIAIVAAPTLLPVVVFYTYIRLGNAFDAARIFTAIALFNLLQVPFTFLPYGLALFSQSSVSCQRLLDFFDAEELYAYIDDSQTALDSDGFSIKMSRVRVSWINDGKNVEEDIKFLSDFKKLSKSKKPHSMLSHKLSHASQRVSQEIQSQMISFSISASNGFPALERQFSRNAKSFKSAEVATLYTYNESLDTTFDEMNRSIYTLSDISVSIKKGSLVAVVGSVGSGKSSFLSTLLGELHLKSGSVRVVGSVSYCDQKPWILNATVKDNILFGRPYDELKFAQAIHAASMEDDIRILSAGVMTEIGEQGINLSGGQKARVALARAVYCDSDIYLFDDPLSAVDAHVGQHLFHHCIKQVLGDKTRVLVTHHVHLLPHCDLVIILEDGKIKISGSYEDIVNSGIDIKSIVPSETGNAPEALVSFYHPQYTNVETKDYTAAEQLENLDMTTIADVILETDVDIESPHVIDVKTACERARRLSDPVVFRNGLPESKPYDLSQNQTSKTPKPINTGALVIDEEQNEGSVALEAYSYYARSGGITNCFVIFILLCGSQCIQVESSFWLSDWGKKSLIGQYTGDPLSLQQNITYLNGYAGLACGYLGAFMLWSVFLANHRVGTSRGLHSDLLRRVLGAPVAFFDTTPLGRILNRFSSDLLTIDDELSQTLSQLLNAFFSCLGSLGAIAASTRGIFLPLFVPLAFVYQFIQKYFRRSNTAFARLESISRSPIYADFNQVLSGVSSIRAYREQDRFVKHLEEMVDRNSIANITSQNASQWLAIRLDLLGSIVTFFVALLAILAPSGFIPAEYLALGLAYSFQLTFYLKIAVRVGAQFEAQMNSVERLMYYIENIEQEGLKKEVPAENIPREWPQEGVITGKNIKMRYRDGPLVLKGVDFDIQAHEKIGIAGRTGSGKSSMMIALFRIQELAEGSISIDGIDISTVPLPVLRSRLGIIPQDPVMFSASIRFNLDPFSEHTDQELWDVLDRVRMKDHVLSVPGKLMEEVAEGGDNFSTGQRQLICIARALLRRPKILVLDEATASIDNETDDMIQFMIREQFKSCTVLTIAHRLNTIIDSDRIMVLDSGKLAEFDTSDNLLSKEDGLFNLLWQRHQGSRSFRV